MTGSNKGLSEGSKPSFFERHLHLLDIEASPRVQEDKDAQNACANDLAAMKNIQLPRLELKPLFAGQRTTSEEPQSLFAWFQEWMNGFFAGQGGLVGALAMVLLVIVPVASQWRQSTAPSGIDVMRPKGASKVSLYLEHDGQVGVVEPGTLLKNGDRVRTEVMASADTVAFQFVTDLDHRLLMNVDEVVRDGILIPAGGRILFPGSIELVGENDRESLHILLCAKGVNLSQVSDFIAGFSGGDLALPNSCLIKTFDLR